MGTSEPGIELDPGYLREMLNVLSDFKIRKFECSSFKVAFEEPEKEEAPVSTDVRGFEAPSPAPKADEEEPEQPKDRLALHRTALRGMVPSLKPKD